MLFDAKLVRTAFMNWLNSPLMLCSVSHIRQMLVLRSESHLTVKSPKTNGLCVNIRQLCYTVFRGNGMKFVKVSMETKYKKKVQQGNIFVVHCLYGDIRHLSKRYRTSVTQTKTYTD